MARPALRLLGLLLFLLGGWGMSLAESLPNPFPAGCFTVRTLPNGLRVVVREDHSLPIISMVVVVRGGSGVEEASGAAHFLEHLVLQGTKKYPGHLAPQYALEQVGGVSNATTSRDMTRFQATIDSSRLDLLVDVLADVSLAATLDEEAFARERPTVLSEIQQMGDMPQAVLVNLGYEYSFRTHPYRNRPTGSMESVLGLYPDDVRGFYHRWYVPNNISVVLVGDVTQDAVDALIDKAFGAAKASTLPAWPGLEPAPGEMVRKHIPSESKYTYQLLVLPAPPVGEFTSTVTADVIMSLLANGGDGLLLEQWTKDGISVFDFGSEYVSSRGPGRLLVWAMTAPDQAMKLRQSTLRLLEELAAHPVTVDVLAQAKQRLAIQVLTENETYSQQAATLAFYEGLGGVETATRYMPAVGALTAENVQAAMPTRLLAWITLGHQPEGER